MSGREIGLGSEGRFSLLEKGPQRQRRKRLANPHEGPECRTQRERDFQKRMAGSKGGGGKSYFNGGEESKSSFLGNREGLTHRAEAIKGTEHAKASYIKSSFV